MPKPVPTAYVQHEDADANAEEEKNVHEVYDLIAPHFSQTRFKPWPLINKFITSLPANSLGLDSGTGNGKYLPLVLPSGSVMLGLDRSMGLLQHAKAQAWQEYGGMECLRGDLGWAGWRRGVFDFTISVAAIHHLSTTERRLEAIKAILPPLYHATRPPYARFMIYVWAYEQGDNSKRKMGTASAGSGEERVQDVLVPWVLTAPQAKKEKVPKTRKRKGKGRDEGNREESAPDPVQETIVSQPELPADAEQPEAPKVFHRYYHLFVEGELGQNVRQAGVEEGYRVVEADEGGSIEDGVKWLRIVSEGWEADNWWLEGEVGVGPRKAVDS